MYYQLDGPFERWIDKKPAYTMIYKTPAYTAKYAKGKLNGVARYYDFDGCVTCTYVFIDGEFIYHPDHYLDT